MGVFVARRLLRMLATILVASFVFFTAITILPGDPVRALFGAQGPPPEVYQAVREQYRLDEPFVTQYLHFMGDLISGDLGRALPQNPSQNNIVGPPIEPIVAQTAPVSLRIIGATLVVEIVVGGVLAVVATIRNRSPIDLTTYATALILVSVPVMVAAYALQTYVGLEIGWLPHRWFNGYGWLNYVLPVAALSAGFAGYLLLIGRTELLATAKAPFMRTPDAFGFPRRRAIVRHAIRPSVAPVIAFVTANLGNLVAGLVVVEAIFDVPGLGSVLFYALQTPDRILGAVLMMILLVVVIVANAIGDIFASAIDPRIRLQET